MSYYSSPATKSGRPLKADAIPEAIVEYLSAYRYVNQLLLGFQGRGGGRSGGGGNLQRDSSGNCGQHSMWWWGNDILDTGTPPGERAGVQGNPAPLVDMNHTVYPNNNIIFEKGYCYYVPAKNGIAQGQRKPLLCSVFNHGAGFGFGFSIGTPDPSGSQISQENIEKKLAYRQLYMNAAWATKELDDLIYTGGFARGGGQGGGSDGGQRIIHANIGGQSQQIYVDTGTDAILGAGNGSKQCVFDPNPQSISIPSTSHRQGRSYFVPAWSISQRLKICLTSEYTICPSLGQGGTISYRVSDGQKILCKVASGVRPQRLHHNKHI
ncbi:MAG TPA: hypothetical protein VH593_11655, partial [Ktedonobacteraceae bacterium]